LVYENQQMLNLVERTRLLWSDKSIFKFR